MTSEPTMPSRRLKFLLVNQAFYPDIVATAQVLTDLGQALVSRGHEVTVVSSSRGYDSPDAKYPSSEQWNGIQIHRIWTPGLGKASKWRRILDFSGFWLSAIVTLLRLPRADVTVSLTSPPLISVLATAISLLKGGSSVQWIMDLNPDEAVAAGWIREDSIINQIFSMLQNWSFHHSQKIVVLDRFMAERLKRKGINPTSIDTVPPWSQDDHLAYDEKERREFRRRYGLEEKYVVMYSGNHSPCHPLDTILSVAKKLRDETQIHFVFIGGGSEFKKVERFRDEHQLFNLSTYPYVPNSELSGSLSSADLHLVVMGQPFVGIVHPCKVYNILKLGTPILFVGPTDSHVGDLHQRMGDSSMIHFCSHGDVDRALMQIRTLAQQKHRQSRDAVESFGMEYSKNRVMPKLIDLLEEIHGD